MTPQTFVALTTPFGSDDAIDFGALHAHIQWLAEHGIDGVMVCGTSGEGPLLCDDELLSVASAAVASCNELRVLANVPRAGTRATAGLVERLVETGVDAVSAVVPYYYQFADAELLAHFSAVVRAAGDVPSYVYTIPAHTGNDLAPATVRTLVGEGLTGIKDSAKTPSLTREYIATGADVLIGSDGLILDALNAGCAGSITISANLRPGDAVTLARAHLDRDVEEAEDAQERIRVCRSKHPSILATKLGIAELLPGYPARVRAPLA